MSTCRSVWNNLTPIGWIIVMFYTGHFLGALAKLRKATVSYVISDNMEQLGSHPADFHEISFMRICQKSLDKIEVL
jgi:uncharacterized membrane protein SpoIIM required for sporulation